MTVISSLALNLRMPNNMINEVNKSDCDKTELTQAATKLNGHMLNIEQLIQKRMFNRSEANIMQGLLEKDFKHALIEHYCQWVGIHDATLINAIKKV